ncbi:MAG: tetratricopeptide repeat protein [Nitrospirota bacterium]
MILRNPAVHRLDRLPEHFQSVTIGNTQGTPSYRPLVMVSYGLNYAWGKDNPVGYHVVNIALHVMASAMAALLLWQLLGCGVSAFWGAAVFALHPIQTEAVNYITARSSVLYSLAAVAAVWAFARYRTTGRRFALSGAVAAYAASLLAKEAAVMVPLLLVGYDVVVRRCAWKDRSTWAAYVPFVVVTVVYLLWRQRMMGAVIPSSSVEGPLTVGLTFAAIVTKTLGGQLFPIDLSVSHAFGPIRTMTTQALGAVAVCACLAGVAVGAWRRAPVLAYAALWFPAALLPVAALTVITPLALYQENRGYLSAVAVALSAGPLLAWCWERSRARAVVVGLRRLGVIALLAAMVVAVIGRNPVWRDEVSLWRDVLAGAPGNQAAYLNLGLAYVVRGNFEAAEDVYLRALERFPYNAGVYVNLGQIYRTRGYSPAAEDVYLRTLERVPDNGLLHNGLGELYLARGEVARAEDAFRTAIRVAPLFAMPYVNLALILDEQGARDAAIAAYQKFLELAPGQPGTAPHIEVARQRLSALDRDGGAGRFP